MMLINAHWKHALNLQKTYGEKNVLKQWLAQSQQLLHLVLSKWYNTNAPYPAEDEQFSSQWEGANAENKWAKAMTCSKPAANALEVKQIR